MKLAPGNYKVAIQLSQQGRLKSAQLEFERCLADHPDHLPQISFDLASHAYRCFGDGQEARRLFEQVLGSRNSVTSTFTLSALGKVEGFARVGLLELSLSYEEFFKWWKVLSEQNQDLAEECKGMYEFVVKAQEGGYPWWQIMSKAAYDFADPTGRRPNATQFARGLAFYQLLLKNRKQLRIPREEWRRLVTMCTATAKAAYFQNVACMERMVGRVDYPELAHIGEVATPLLEEYIAENPDDMEVAQEIPPSLPWRKMPPSSPASSGNAPPAPIERQAARFPVRLLGYVFSLAGLVLMAASFHIIPLPVWLSQMRNVLLILGMVLLFLGWVLGSVR